MAVFNGPVLSLRAPVSVFALSKVCVTRIILSLSGFCIGVASEKCDG